MTLLLLTPEAVRGFHLFKGLDEKSAKQVAKILHPKTFNKGETIFQAGDPCEGFYLVQNGSVKVFKLSPDGREQILHIAGPGASFAEAAVFLKGKYPANAQALKASELYLVERDAFSRLMRERKEFAMNVFGSLSLRLKHLTDLVESLTLRDARGRLLRYLGSLAEEGAGASKSPLVLTLPLPKHQLAKLLGIASETLSRVLLSLEEEGVLSMKGKTIRILDPERLKDS